MSDCWSCSGRLFHSVGPAVAKQRSPNWLRDLLTKHVRLSADHRGWRPVALLIEQCLTSHQTHYRSYRGRFLQVIWPNQQCQSTEGSPVYIRQLVIQERCWSTNDRHGWISWNPLVSGLAASAADVGLAWCDRTAWLLWWDVRRRSELTAGGSSNHLLCRSTAEVDDRHSVDCCWTWCIVLNWMKTNVGSVLSQLIFVASFYC